MELEDPLKKEIKEEEKDVKNIRSNTDPEDSPEPMHQGPPSRQDLVPHPLNRP